MTGGFANEREMGKWMLPRMKGTWKLVEMIYPSGHPDIMGASTWSGFAYIELKIGRPLRSAFEASQLEFIPWLQSWGLKVYSCFGSTTQKKVQFFDGLNFEEQINPLFWRGTLLRP